MRKLVKIGLKTVFTTMQLQECTSHGNTARCRSLSPQQKPESRSTKREMGLENHQSRFPHKMKSTACEEPERGGHGVHARRGRERKVFRRKRAHWRETSRNPSRGTRLNLEPKWRPTRTLDLKNEYCACAATAPPAAPLQLEPEPPITCSHAAPARGFATAQAHTPVPQPP